MILLSKHHRYLVKFEDKSKNLNKSVFKSSCQREVFFADNTDKLKFMNIYFENEEEIDILRNDQTYKLNIRNTLGIKSSEDWIFNLYIGNVMHLAPLK